VQDWWASPEWYSTEENVVAEKMDKATRKYEAATAEYEKGVALLGKDLEEARKAATAGQRQLLRGQNDPLQEAVRSAAEYERSQLSESMKAGLVAAKAR
jgi:hypothetical protein